MAICSGSTLLSLLAFLACEPSDRSTKKLSGNEQSDFREESSISIEFEDLVMDLCCRLFQRDRIRRDIVIRFEYLNRYGILRYSQKGTSNASVSQIMSKARIASGFVRNKIFFISEILLATKVKRSHHSN